MNISAVILAGGLSRRMGWDKAWLPVGGRPLIRRQIDIVSQLAPVEIFISGRMDTDYTQLSCPVLHDRYLNAGPLAGIESALAAASSPFLLVLAVDMPAMSASFLRRLATNCTGSMGAIPRLNGFVEPLAAVYPKSAQSLAQTHLRNHDSAVKSFAERCVQSGLASFYDLSVKDTKYFTNFNMPADARTSTKL